VNEAVKILSGCNFNMDNYMMYMGQTGVFTNTFVYEREEVSIFFTNHLIALHGLLP
jgi:hypothetical protein